MRTLITTSIMALFLISTLPAALAATSVATASVGSAPSSASYLENASPYVVLKTAGTNLFSRISANQQAIAKFPHLMRDIVEEE